MDLINSDVRNVLSSSGVHPLRKIIDSFVDRVDSLVDLGGLLFPVIIVKLGFKFVLPPAFEVTLFFLQNLGKLLAISFDDSVPRLTIVVLDVILASGNLLFDRVDQLWYGRVWIHHFGSVQLVPFSVEQFQLS